MGSTLELPGYMDGDTRSTHTEQCRSINVAQGNNLSPVRAEERIPGYFPMNTVLCKTMDPCNARFSGTGTCCDRTVAMNGCLRTVFIGIREPGTFIANDDGKQQADDEDEEDVD